MNVCVWVYVASGYSRHFDISDFVSGIWKHTYFDITAQPKSFMFFLQLSAISQSAGLHQDFPEKRL